jgi:hypothetical protein
MLPNDKITDVEAQQVLLFNLLCHYLPLASTEEHMSIPLSEDETKLPEKLARRMEGCSEGKAKKLAQLSGKTMITPLNILNSLF